MSEEVSTITTQPETTPKSEAVAPVRSKVKKAKTRVSKGRICINATFNNTLISATDAQGHVLAWGTAGKMGFKGSKKSTPYAGQRTMEDLLARLKNIGLAEVEVFMKGLGAGRESAVRVLHGSGLMVTSIQDRTAVAHGGVRPKKPRRL